MADSFDSVARECRILESKITQNIGELVSFLSSIRSPDSEIDNSVSLCNNVRDTIEHQLENLHSSARKLHSLSQNNVGQYQLANGVSQRHESLKRQFESTWKNILRERNRVELLQGAVQTEGHILTDENTRTRASIAASHSIADELMDQVDVARNSLLDQREHMLSTTGRLSLLLSKFPAIDSIVRATRIRRVRNTLIWGLVLFLIILVTFFLKRK
ncbi:hypothetical protein P9112_009078 [Eukaryota sp. TZLM1-RC]